MYCLFTLYGLFRIGVDKSRSLKFAWLPRVKACQIFLTQTQEKRSPSVESILLPLEVVRVEKNLMKNGLMPAPPRSVLLHCTRLVLVGPCTTLPSASVTCIFLCADGPGLAPPQCKGRYYQQRVDDAYIAVCVQSTHQREHVRSLVDKEHRITVATSTKRVEVIATDVFVLLPHENILPLPILLRTAVECH